MDEGPSISFLLAQGFWEGYLPTDVSQEVLDVLELTAMGPPGLEQLESLVTAWQQRAISSDSLFAQAMGMFESFDAAARQAAEVRDLPENDSIRRLLHAVCEALHALAEASAAVAESSACLHGGALSRALAAAGEAAFVLGEVYDGTHFEG